jgi:hypothetical protein
VVLKRFLTILAVALVTAALTYALRSLLVEPRHLHEQCSLDMNTTLCIVRQAVVMGFVLNIYPIASAALGLLALGLHSQRCAWGAIVLGVMGALFYRTDLAAVGLLLGAVAATRPPIAPQHGERHP